MVRLARPLLLACLGALALGPACAKKAVPDRGPRWDDGAHYAYQATIDGELATPNATAAVTPSPTHIQP